MIKKILIALVLLIVVLVIVVAFQPADYRVSRSATISAPPAVVFAQVNDLHKWEAWSPWAKLDPAAKTSYAGPEAGTGAMMKWAGNSKVGTGMMTITESKPNELVRFKLDFVKPFEGTSTAEFNFKPQGEQTLVTWSMEGKNNFIGKGISLFMSMDKMIGGQFEKGLADLKSVSAAAAQK